MPLTAKQSRLRAEIKNVRRLSAVDERTLSASIKGLFIGERGWITLPEARALFSLMDEDYAFGEMDEKG
jgi:hypothetical protein